jgi:Ni/Co efflux regulator RcnB
MLKKLLVVLVASAFTAGAYAQPKPAEPAKSTEAAKPADTKAAKADKKAERKAKKQAKKEAKAKKDVK